MTAKSRHPFRFVPPVLAALALSAASITRADPPPPAPPSAAPSVPPGAIATISDEEARLELARVLVYAKRYDEALVQYRRVIDVRPGDHALRAEYGRVLGWAGRGPDAMAALSAVPEAELTPGDAVLLADLVLADKDYARAAGLYRQALAANPGDHGTRFKLARVLSWEKDYESALAEFDRILAALPDDVQVRRHRAQVLGWAGRPEEAAAEWRRTLPETSS